MLRAMVVDDEKLMLEDIVWHLNDVNCIVTEFTRPKQALSWFRVHSAEIDVVFLDVVMPELNGFDVAEVIQNIQPDIPIVFVSGHDKYAIQAFEMAALDYILKPLTCERTEKALQRIHSMLAHNKRSENKAAVALSKLERNELWEKKRLRSILLKQLSGEHNDELLLYKNGNWRWVKKNALIAFRKGKTEKYVQVMTADNYCETMETFTDFSLNFEPEDWIVCYRAVHVKISAIEKMAKNNDGEIILQMKNSRHEIPVSRNYLDQVIVALNRR
ncbi:MAG: LytTR family DNA-binding domain-containing protein [Negativicutes bacterium]|jgi:DNA-binding LytR/AlgR family response regulator